MAFCRNLLLIGTAALFAASYVASASSFTKDLSEWDPERYSKNCFAKYTHIKSWTEHWFFGLSDGKRLAEVIQTYVMTSKLQLNAVLVGTAAWMAILLLGVIWFFVAVAFATCVSKSVRKCWAKCSGCCKRRPRKDLKSIKQATVWGYSIGTAVLSIALVSCAVCTFIWSDYYKHQFQQMKCDVWSLLKESMVGKSERGEYQDAVNDYKAGFIGFINLDKRLQTAEDIRNNAGNSTVIQLVNNTNWNVRGANELQFLFRSVQSALQTQEYQHYCAGCLTEFIAEANATLTEAEGISGKIGQKLLDIFHEPDTSTTLTDYIKAFVNGWQLFLRNVRAVSYLSNLFVSSVFWISIAMGIIALIALILLWWAVVEVVVDHQKNRKPAKRTQKLFGCLFPLYAFLGSIAFIFIGSILVLGGYSNGGCYFVKNNLHQPEVWYKLFGSTEFGMSIRNCVILNKTNFLLQKEQGTIKEYQDIFIKWTNKINIVREEYLQDAAVVIAKFNRVLTVFPDYSWIVVPNPATLPAAVFPQVAMSSLDYNDHDVSCDGLNLRYKSPLATACAADLTADTVSSTTTTTTTTAAGGVAAVPKTTKVFGLETLNKVINDNANTQIWCMASVMAKTPTAVGCASPSRQIIAPSTKRTDANIVAEFNAIHEKDAARAQGWLHAVGVAIQKEMLLADRIFSCQSLGLCPASVYMPYVTSATAAASPFVGDAQARVALMKTTTQSKVNESAGKIDQVKAKIQQDGVDVIDNSNAWANCNMISSAFYSLRNDLCQRFLPSISALPVATFLLALASLLGTPLLWVAYYYILDLRKEEAHHLGTVTVVGDDDDVLVQRGAPDSTGLGGESDPPAPAVPVEPSSPTSTAPPPPLHTAEA